MQKIVSFQFTTFLISGRPNNVHLAAVQNTYCIIFFLFYPCYNDQQYNCVGWVLTFYVIVGFATTPDILYFILKVLWPAQVLSVHSNDLKILPQNPRTNLQVFSNCGWYFLESFNLAYITISRLDHAFSKTCQKLCWNKRISSILMFSFALCSSRAAVRSSSFRTHG